MRIISGRFKGRRFDPPLKRCKTRPTMDMAKEGIFNILGGYYDFEDLEVLDLFGGTGSISLEFVSRACTNVTYVDHDYNCVRFVNDIIKKLDIADEMSTTKQDSISFLSKTASKYDIIFADPPYNYKNIEKIIAIVEERKLIKRDGLLILEHDQRHDFSTLPYHFKTKIYGTNRFSFFDFNDKETT